MNALNPKSLTMEDILTLQKRLTEERVKESCDNCKHRYLEKTTGECKECVNSFCGVYFTPSNWRKP